MPKKKKAPAPITVTGLTWYRSRQDFDRLKAMAKDPEKLPVSYSTWLQDAMRVRQELERSGITVVKAYLDPVEFPTWCLAQGIDMDVMARMEFAREFASRTETF
ncbi:MAG: hypothetical protein U0Q16_01655 [Bryobacteraceae bacterium]